MRVKYIVPTCGRADTMTTLDLLSRAVALVSPQEYETYRAYHPEYGPERFLVAPDGVQGNGKSRALNWMLDTQWKDADAIIHLDDDIKWFASHTKGDHQYKRIETEEEVYELLENFALLAKEWGCGMFGISPNKDPLVYQEFAPFKTLSYIDGGVVGYVRDDGIRYDEELTIKEDVDFFLQQVKRYHKALRVEKYWVEKESFTNSGGCQLFRSPEEEKRQFQIMQRKWGSNVIRPNKPTARKSSKIRSYGGAIKLRIPLEGI